MVTKKMLAEFPEFAEYEAAYKEMVSLGKEVLRCKSLPAKLLDMVRRELDAAFVTRSALHLDAKELMKCR